MTAGVQDLSSVGLIQPPPDIRNIIDRTAAYVAKHGSQFESKIQYNERNNIKFNFLQENDPYHAYYRHKVKSSKEGASGGAPPPPPPPPSQEQPATEAGQATQTAGAGAVLEKKGVKTGEKTGAGSALLRKLAARPITQPEDFEFNANPPPASAADIDMIKLTAQFVARNGRQFLHGLASREARNPQFDFLKPTHYMFGFFTAMVEQYTKILDPPADLISDLKKKAADRTANLERSFNRMRFEKRDEDEKAAREANEEEERLAFMTIDWKDFVVVETIHFDDDGEEDLPAPKAIEGDDAGDQDMDMDMDMDMDIEEKGDVAALGSGSMKIVKNYQGIQPSRAQKPMQECPRCKQLIPVDEMAEHMRIELLDPKWREQQEQQRANAKVDAGLAEGDEISKNLASFASKRREIMEGKTSENEIARNTARDKEGRVVWDGHSGSINRTTNAALSIEEQVRQIEEAKRKREEEAKIGPAMPDGSVAGGEDIEAQQQAMQAQHGMPGGYGAPGGAGLMPTPVVAPMGAAPAHYNPYMANMPPNMQSGMMPPPPGPPGQLPPGMPPSMPAGMPPGMPPGMAPPPPPSDPEEMQRQAKRQKLESAMGSLLSEDEFIAKHGSVVKVPVQCPSHNDWGLKGQLLEVDMSPKDTVQALKEKLKDLLEGMPPAKMKLSHADLGFLKEQQSVAFYNLAPGNTVQLGVKERGGRKK